MLSFAFPIEKRFLCVSRSQGCQGLMSALMAHVTANVGRTAALDSKFLVAGSDVRCALVESLKLT